MKTYQNFEAICGNFSKENTPYVIATSKEKKVVSHLSAFVYLIMIVIFFLSLSAFGQ